MTLVILRYLAIIIVIIITIIINLDCEYSCIRLTIQIHMRNPTNRHHDNDRKIVLAVT